MLHINIGGGGATEVQALTRRQTRTANIICPEAHEFWETVKDASSFYAYFDELFPQIAWRETVRHLPGRGAPGRARRDGRLTDAPDRSRKVPVSEATEFARQKGGRFPLCQRVETLGAALGDGEGAAGVVLLGDASHCFPPDSAQGVNAALEDVAVLSSIVDETGGDKGMGGVAAAYAERRGPDVEALLKLARTTNPWQYGQSSPTAKLGQLAWAMNFILRKALHRILPSVFSESSFILIQSMWSESYTKIWATAQRTTAILATMAVAAVGVGVKVGAGLA